MFLKLTSTFAAVIVFTFCGIPAFADTLNTTGSVQVSSTSANFYPLAVSTGSFSVSSQDTGIFGGLSGTSGAIVDLNTAAEPIGATVNVANFMTFTSASNLSFTLTEILPGMYSACAPPPPVAGQTCTPAGTPYNLSNVTATSAMGTAAVYGYVVNSNNPGGKTPFIGTFTAQFTDESYQQVLAALQGAGVVDATYTAQFVTTPEPGTMVTLFSGSMLLFGIGMFAKRARS